MIGHLFDSPLFEEIGVVLKVACVTRSRLFQNQGDVDLRGVSRGLQIFEGNPRCCGARFEIVIRDQLNETSLVHRGTARIADGIELPDQQVEGYGLVRQSPLHH